MILHKWGVLPYETARRKMDDIHNMALCDGQNHLILVQHPACFTIGKESWEKKWSVPVIKSDRGGSITCHSEGQNIYYFCFQTPKPVYFFTKVRTVFSNFFDTFDKSFFYDKKKPGFYRQKRKICSLGFRYKNGVSLHGVSLNVDVDLNFHNQIHPCGLQDVVTTSLVHEDIHINCENVNNFIVSEVIKVFDESL